MTDLLTHVLAAYAVGTVAVWRAGVPRRYVPVAMIGAILPDLAKVELLVSAGTLEAVLGLPVSWQAFHRLGGALVLAGLVALAFPEADRRPAFGALVVGVASHFLLDLGVERAGGVAPPYLYPFSWWEPPSLGLYLSSDPWPAVVAVVIATGVWVADRRRA